MKIISIHELDVEKEMLMIAVYICKDCHHAASTFSQPEIMLNHKKTLQVECHTLGCPQWKLTTDSRDHADMVQRFTIQKTRPLASKKL